MPRSRRDSPVEDDPGESEGMPGRTDETVGHDARRKGAKARSATVWTWAIPALVFIVVMLIFILQNFQNVEVSFVSLHGKFPLALCLLFAAVLGALIIAFAEIARAVQLRRRARRDRPPL